MHPWRRVSRRVSLASSFATKEQVEARHAEPRSLDIVCLEAKWRLQCRTRKARANAHPPRRRCRSVRFTPTAATSIVTSTSETRRPRGIRVCLQHRTGGLSRTPESVLPDLPTFVGIWRKSFQASAHCTSMGDESTRTSENCKILRMTRSSMYTSPIVFMRGQGSPLINRDRSFSARAASKCQR